MWYGIPVGRRVLGRACTSTVSPGGCQCTHGLYRAYPALWFSFHQRPVQHHSTPIPPKAIPVPMHYSTALRLLSTSSGKAMHHRRHGDTADESANPHREVLGGDLNESVVNRWLRLARTRTLAVAFQLAADVTVSRLVAVLNTAIVLAQVRVTTGVPGWSRRTRVGDPRVVPRSRFQAAKTLGAGKAALEPRLITCALIACALRCPLCCADDGVPAVVGAPAAVDPAVHHVDGGGCFELHCGHEPWCQPGVAPARNRARLAGHARDTRDPRGHIVPP